MAPRLSIIPGRFVEDPRPDLNHYKVLNALGRHTDEDGWCRIKQAGLGQSIGLSRECVCRKVGDLTEWGYVEKHDEDGSGRAIWYRVLLDSPGRPPTPRDADPAAPAEPSAGPPPRRRGRPKAGDQPAAEPDLPVMPASQVDASNNSTCDALGITPGVTPGDHTRCDAWRHNKERPFLTTLPNDFLPQPPPAPVAATGEGDVEIPWIEALRAEGQPAAVLDRLLAPLVAGGLPGWKGADGSRVDPKGPARRLCADLAGSEPALLDRLCEAVRRSARYRLPPVATMLELAEQCRADLAREAERAARVARLPEVACDGGLTRRFRDVLASVATPEVHRAWFEPAGVSRVTQGRVVHVVTVHVPRHVEQFAQSPADAAARALTGRPDAVAVFEQGRIAA